MSRFGPFHLWYQVQIIGGIGVECQLFFKRLEEKSRKNGEPHAEVIAYLRTRISLTSLDPLHIGVRGSRTPFRKARERRKSYLQYLERYIR